MFQSLLFLIPFLSEFFKARPSVFFAPCGGQTRVRPPAAEQGEAFVLTIQHVKHTRAFSARAHVRVCILELLYTCKMTFDHC